MVSCACPLVLVVHMPSGLRPVHGSSPRSLLLIGGSHGRLRAAVEGGKVRARALPRRQLCLPPYA